MCTLGASICGIKQSVEKSATSTRPVVSFSAMQQKARQRYERYVEEVPESFRESGIEIESKRENEVSFSEMQRQARERRGR